MMTVFVIQNIMHFLKRNLKQGSSYPPLFSFAFTRPTLEYFLKNHSKDCEERLCTWPCWNQGPALYYSPVYRLLQWIEWNEWVPRLHQRGTFFFFLGIIISILRAFPYPPSLYKQNVVVLPSNENFCVINMTEELF